MTRLKTSLLLAASLATTAAVPGALAQQVTGTLGSPSATTTGQPRAAAGARPEVRRRHQGRRAAVEGLVGAAHRAAQGRAQRAADHHRRRRLRRAEHLRRRHPDADDGPHRERRPALQPHVLHRAVLADARRADHRAQPPLGRLRRHLRAVDRLPRLQQHHRQGQGDDRPHAAGQRLFHRVVRQGPQHAGLRRQPGRAVRPVARRHGLRVLLRLRRRRRQPVAAEPVPQHDADLSVPGQAGLEPDHRHGRRRHRLHDADPPDATRQADLHQVRAGRDARPAPPDQGVGGQDPARCTCSTTATRSCASASSRTRRSSA